MAPPGSFPESSPGSSRAGLTSRAFRSALDSASGINFMAVASQGVMQVVTIVIMARLTKGI